MNRNDLAADILARATSTTEIELLGHYKATVATMPNGTDCLLERRGDTWSLQAICTRSGKYMVDGVMHHSKYGWLRGFGSMWANARRGKGLSARGRHTHCVLALYNAAIA